MNFFAQYGLFALKSLTIVISLILAVAGIVAVGKNPRPKLTITSLNQEFDDIKQVMHKEVTGKKLKKKKLDHEKHNLYVLDFIGDIKASQVEQLREEISAILTVATSKDEVVVRIESPGGSVNGYGLATSQLQRITDKNILLTVCIDKIAASGGYLMASVAHRILAAPFAIIGSIGVVSQIPNFHRFLRKHDIDVELLTAGEYKRTLTLFAENTEKGRKKFQEDLEKIHDNFKQYVLTNRHQLDMEKVATGEHWLGKDALELGLVDALQTSDAYLIDKMESFNLYKVHIHAKQNLVAKLLKPTMKLLHPWA